MSEDPPSSNLVIKPQILFESNASAWISPSFHPFSRATSKSRSIGNVSATPGILACFYRTLISVY